MNTSQSFSLDSKVCRESPSSSSVQENSFNSSTDSISSRPFAHLGGGSAPSSPELRSPPLNSLSKFKNTINLNTLFQTDTNQSMDSKYVRNTIPIFPATVDTSQMLILRYLTSMGEYQEVIFFSL